MVICNFGAAMSFGGSAEPAALVELGSIGKLGADVNKGHSKAICDHLTAELGLAADRCVAVCLCRSAAHAPRELRCIRRVVAERGHARLAVQRLGGMRERAVLRFAIRFVPLPVVPVNCTYM